MKLDAVVAALDVSYVAADDVAAGVVDVRWWLAVIPTSVMATDCNCAAADDVDSASSYPSCPYATCVVACEVQARFLVLYQVRYSGRHCRRHHRHRCR